MKVRFSICLAGLVASAGFLLAGSLPEITVHPTNQLVTPGSEVVFAVTAPLATSFQWRFNGADLQGAEASTLVLTNVQAADRGYYMAVAKNETGWVPSQMAYLAVVDGPGGIVPRHNLWSTNTQVRYASCGPWYEPIFPGSAQVYAGPEMDQMQPVGPPIEFHEPGYYAGEDMNVPTVEPGQTVYYRVKVTYPCEGRGDTNWQFSYTLEMIAGGGEYPIPTAEELHFPTFIGGESPVFFTDLYPVNQVRIVGETVHLWHYGWSACDAHEGSPMQWRKDGRPIPGATNTNTPLTLTEFDTKDVGVYDAVFGCGGGISPKQDLAIQLIDGKGRFANPRLLSSEFSADLIGAPRRVYEIQASSNLVDWLELQAVTNWTGVVGFTNATGLAGRQFYRAVLAPALPRFYPWFY